MTDCLFLGSKITADGDCSREIRRHLLLRRKAMTDLGSILKSRDSTLPTNVCIVKAMVFPVVMYRCENRTIKKAEHQRIDVKPWCWRRPLRVPCLFFIYFCSYFYDFFPSTNFGVLLLFLVSLGTILSCSFDVSLVS